MHVRTMTKRRPAPASDIRETLHTIGAVLDILDAIFAAIASTEDILGKQ